MSMTRNHRTTRRLGMLTAGVALAAVSFLGVDRPAQAATGCATNCFTSFRTTQQVADKVNLTFEFGTSVATRTTIVVARQDGRVLSLLVDPAYRTSHVMSAPFVMEQGVEYQYSVTVTDQAGNSRTEQSDVYAVQRQVRLTVDRLRILNDSDLFGPGEIRAGLRLGRLVSTILPLTSIEDPATVMTNSTLVVDKAGLSLPYAIEVQDEDAESGRLCRPAVFTWGSGSSGCVQRMTANSAVVSSLVPMPTTKTITLRRTGVVAFEVTLTYTIDYV